MKSKNPSASTWDTSTWDRKRATEDRRLLNESRSWTRKSESYLKDTNHCVQTDASTTKSPGSAALPRYSKNDCYVYEGICAPGGYLRENGQLSERDLSSIGLTVSGLVTGKGKQLRFGPALRHSAAEVGDAHGSIGRWHRFFGGTSVPARCKELGWVRPGYASSLSALAYNFVRLREHGPFLY